MAAAASSPTRSVSPQLPSDSDTQLSALYEEVQDIINILDINNGNIRNLDWTKSPNKVKALFLGCRDHFRQATERMNHLFKRSATQSHLASGWLKAEQAYLSAEKSLEHLRPADLKEEINSVALLVRAVQLELFANHIRSNPSEAYVIWDNQLLPPLPGTYEVEGDEEDEDVPAGPENSRYDRTTLLSEQRFGFAASAPHRLRLELSDHFRPHSAAAAASAAGGSSGGAAAAGAPAGKNSRYEEHEKAPHNRKRVRNLDEEAQLALAMRASLDPKFDLDAFLASADPSAAAGDQP